MEGKQPQNTKCASPIKKSNNYHSDKQEDDDTLNIDIAHISPELAQAIYNHYFPVTALQIDMNEMCRPSTLNTVVCKEKHKIKAVDYLKSCNIEITIENGIRTITNKGTPNTRDSICVRIMELSSQYHISIGKLWKMLYYSNGYFDVLERHLKENGQIWSEELDSCLHKMIATNGKHQINERIDYLLSYWKMDAAPSLI